MIAGQNRTVDRVFDAVLHELAKEESEHLRHELEQWQFKYGELYQENKRLKFQLEQLEDHDG